MEIVRLDSLKQGDVFRLNPGSRRYVKTNKIHLRCGRKIVCTCLENQSLYYWNPDCMVEKEQPMQKVKLNSLKPGNVFRRCPGGYRYIKTNQWSPERDILCTGLENGSTYYWTPESMVIPEPSDIEKTENKRILTNQKFFMCYVQDSGVPTVKHTNKALAFQEATRLASTTRKPVYVLETIKVGIPCYPPAPTLVVSWRNTV